ncbi:hypothetical protein Btru_016835 [Bulinus truncatus]|nr:hypothetical protein Btru_016835 [Bulinus truncatus]
MFTYASLLVTMSRNTLTFFRGAFCIDSFHLIMPMTCTYVAFLAILFTVIHCIGHFDKYLHISTQPSSDFKLLLH